MHKKLRAAAVVGASVALFAAACGSGDSSDSASANSGNAQAKDITVWLMNGSAPDAVIKRVNAQFNQAHPNTKVNIQIQQWDGIDPKTTTALASNNPPDVLEIGSTLVSKFADSGGLEDLSSKKADLGGDSWLQGLTDAGTLDGKLYGVPYYAGDRAVLYRKDMFTKAGITSLPTDRATFVADLAKLQAKFGSDKRFSALYFPGQYWYASLPFIWDEGGEVAVQDNGQWKGALDSAQSQAGLSALKDMVTKYSKAPVNGNENDNDPAVPLGEAKAGMIIDAGWKVGTVEKAHPELKGQIGVFALPS
jgi:N,N'-diacetylchitobiose transport system substrate-binding protein